MKAESIPSKKEYILAYDAGCGPCTRFRHLVDILDRYDRIEFMSLVNADQKDLLDEVPPDLRYKSFHLISMRSGQVKSASDGLLELIAILPGGRLASPVIKFFPRGRQTVRFIYTMLSRLHDGGSCNFNNNNDKNQK